VGDKVLPFFYLYISLDKILTLIGPLPDKEPSHHDPEFLDIYESPVCRKSPDGRGNVIIMPRYPVSLADIRRFGDCAVMYIDRTTLII